MGMKRHWSEQDDIVALYLYKFGDLRRTSNLDIVSERRGNPEYLAWRCRFGFPHQLLWIKD